MDTVAPLASDTYVQVNSSTVTEMKSTWESEADLTGVWTSLERDKEGYLVYTPCDGITPRIKIAGNKVSLYRRLEGLNIFRIEHTEMISDRELRIWAFDEDNEDTKAVFKVKIADNDRKLVVWDFSINWPVYQGGYTDYKWVTTRKEFEKDFRAINNNCTLQLKKEMVFLPLEF